MSLVVQGPDLLLADEVGDMFRVTGRQVGRWADAGKISCLRTPGGKRRYHREEVQALLAGKPLTAGQRAAMWQRHRNGGAR